MRLYDVWYMIHSQCGDNFFSLKFLDYKCFYMLCIIIVNARRSMITTLLSVHTVFLYYWIFSFIYCGLEYQKWFSKKKNYDLNLFKEDVCIMNILSSNWWVELFINRIDSVQWMYNLGPQLFFVSNKFIWYQLAATLFIKMIETKKNIDYHLTSIMFLQNKYFKIHFIIFKFVIEVCGYTLHWKIVPIKIDWRI